MYRLQFPRFGSPRRPCKTWLWLAVLSACGPGNQPQPLLPSPTLQVDRGIDLANKTIRLGVLNDESGPAAAIGRPYAVGKRLLAAEINAGDSGLLPAGWKVELVERDHGYNPQRSVQAYLEIKDDVLMIAHSFGSPNTMPLQPMLQRDHMLALPASLSSPMARSRYTIPAGPSYSTEAMRAVDWIVAEAARALAPKAPPRLALVYQYDDYGHDSQAGLRRAAQHHRLQLVSEQRITTVQRDFDGVIAALRESGATHVVLASLPGATAQLLSAAARQRYRPTWIGNSPSWSDAFFNAGRLTADAKSANPPPDFHRMSGLPYWGEAVPGMPRFLDVYQRFGMQLGSPDDYLLISYIQGLLAIDIVRRALETGVATRDGLLAVIGKIRDFDGLQLGQPFDLSTFPYLASTRTRVLRPDMPNKTWTTVGDWAAPRVLLEPSATANGPTASADVPQVR
jgi:ABC-type branched-subunit amino acid transport system substrate-binding protein